MRAVHRLRWATAAVRSQALNWRPVAELLSPLARVAVELAL
jgi:hypothetical protein